MPQPAGGAAFEPAQYLIVTSLVLFPMTVYEGFLREHGYGLSNQTFGAWLGDQAKGLGVGPSTGRPHERRVTGSG